MATHRPELGRCLLLCSWPGPAWICLALLATVEEKRRLLGDRVALRDLQQPGEV